MERDVDRLADERFDVLVVGGGAFGAALVRDAAQRGYRAALVEKDDFGSGASGNSFRMVHGGIRYLQHLDVARVRHSARERRILLATAPHLVHPLPIVMPTRGRGSRGRTLLCTGFLLYDLLTLDRNRGIDDPERRVPACGMLGRQEVLELFPELDARGLTGAGLFWDAQMHHPARLVLAMLRSAAEDGTAVANRAEVTGLLRSGGRVEGARVRDHEGGGEVEVRARIVVLATGGWTDGLLAREAPGAAPPAATFSRDLCLVTDLPAPHRYALAVPGGGRDPDALLSRASRHLFVVPWLGRRMVGVWHRVYGGNPDRLEVGEDEVERFLAELAAACPGLPLGPEHAAAHNTGLVLVEGAGSTGTTPRFGKRSRFIDHREHGLEGLVSLVGVRLTTARYDAERTLDRIADRLPGGRRPCRTAGTPLFGGDVGSIEALRRDVAAAWPELDAASAEALGRGHGSGHRRLRDLADRSAGTRPPGSRPLPGSTVLGVEVVHAVREEMALHLDDVVLRRTELAVRGPPPASALEAASAIMARELGWDDARREREVERARRASTGPARLVPSLDDARDDRPAGPRAPRARA